VLTGIWRGLHGEMPFSPTRCRKVMQMCCCVHNFMLEHYKQGVFALQ
jgi:hypothetical protein